jgi:phenylacetate-CoA ligase
MKAESVPVNVASRPSGSYTRFVSSVLFPLQERVKRHATVAIRRSLEESEWWTPQAIAELQLRRLRALLVDAGANTTYYGELFRRAGFDPSAVTSIADLARLPFLTKSDIRARTEELKSRHASRLARSNTGGSSGEPLVFYLDAERVAHDVAAKWRATRWFGVDIGDPEIVVWGSPIELGAQDRVRAVRDLLLRTALLPAFDMSESRLDDFVRRIRARRPRMLFGYPSALAHIARHAQARSIRLDDIGIEVAFVTSERLYDDQRQTIQRAFGCRVANGYGGRDAGFIAHECPEGKMHVTAEDIVLELVDAAGEPVAAGESGEIVVTHLASRAFPFIRYRTGDFGVLAKDPCPCGRGLPVLEQILGRSTDFVVASDGTVLHGLALIYVVRDLPGIASFRIVQESRALTRVELVPGPGFDPRVRSAISDGMRRRLGADVEIRIEEMATLPRERSGKHRYVVSKVAA